ncbi:MAG TPA: Ig-like domain repeat protein [Vicinamibacterales bacterium]|nr:Ig-like domain repeat protein [Vicinamibacterales bacterium]
MRRLLTIFVIAAAAIATVFQFARLQAAGFTLGNIVVYRVGDGSTGLGSAAAPVFIDEFTASGTLVQSIAMPTSVNGANRRLTSSGSATNDGFLTLSADGRYVMVSGYDANVTTASVATTTSSAVNRVVGRIDNAGTVDTSTVFNGTAGNSFSGGNIRSVASTDGTSIWAIGSVSGVQFLTLGATSSTQISSAITNLRVAGIFAGQLYVSTASGSAVRVGTVSGGTATTTGQTIANLPGFPTSGSPDAFFFADLDGTPGVDTLYVADDGGQVQKYALVSGNWVPKGSVAIATARGITGTVQGGTVTLFVTGSNGATLFSVTDSSGPTGTLSGTPTTLASAGTNKAFRGVALTPSNSQPPHPTNPTGVYTANPNPVKAGTTTVLTVQVTPGTNPSSIGLTVKSDLTAIGIPGVQTFAAGPNNTFTFSAAVPSSLPPATYPLTATVADTNPEHSSTTAAISSGLTVTPPSTAPTGTGSASPSSLHRNESTLLKVSVTPGTNPPSGTISVVGDLSSIGGSSTQAFTGSGNDFTFTATISNTAAFGPQSLPITVSDTPQGRSSTTSISLTVQPPPPPTTVKISQVYGGGGNSGATYTNDFIEIFNDDINPVDVTGWSVQYNSAGTTTGAWQITEICPTGPCLIQPGHYFLVEEAQGNAGTTALPVPNVVGTIAMGAGSAKVALMNINVPIVGQCPAAGTFVDLVGYGSANCAEASAAPVLTNTTAAIRRGNGCQDSDNNAADFVATGPIPRNSLAPANGCGGDPTQPSGLGIATPDSRLPGSSTLLTVRVTPATATPSTGISVSANLAAIGGASSQAFYDDGTHGDLTAGDNIFSVQQTVGAAIETGAKYLVATITDEQSRTATAPITLTVESPSCGVERWEVKVGTDSTVGQVNLGTTVPSTIFDLARFPAPSENVLNTTFATVRIDGVETTLYQIDATMTFYKLETDVDYHIVLDDLNGHTLIAEIPNPGCTLAPNPSGSGPRVFDSTDPFGPGIANARATFDARLQAQTFFQNAGIPVRVKGIGFFDFEHGQTGVAPNAIELHPVLEIFFRANTTTTLQSSGTPVFGQPLGFSATVTSGADHVPTGDLTFFFDGTSMVVPLDETGHASFSTASLPAGDYSMTASYAGDDNSVASVSAPLTFTVARADQSIDFATIAPKTYGASDFGVTASASSGLPVSFSIASGPATISGSTVHISGAGTVVVRASQAGSDNFNPAGDVDRSFDVAPALLSVSANDVTREFGTPNPALTGTLSGVVGGDGITAAFGTSADITSSVGQYVITPVLSDPNGRLINYTVSAHNGVLTIVDTTPPVIDSVTPSVTSIWPPNKKMVPVAIQVSATDLGGIAPSCSVTGVSSDEPGSDQWTITGPLTVSLQADRNGSGDGRIYTIAVSCVDGSGNATASSTTVAVPHDQRQ